MIGNFLEPLILYMSFIHYMDKSIETPDNRDFNDIAVTYIDFNMALVSLLKL